MELNQIKQFRVIANTESISAAAELLYIAQPSLSQTLKRLEDELGTQLFDRRGKKITLNGAGKILLKYCDEIILALDSAKKELNEYTGTRKIDINIAVDSTALMIKEVAENMRRDYPWSIPHFYVGNNKDWDLKICSSMGPDCGSTSTTVIEEHIGVVFPKSHYLSTLSEITKQDIAECDMISLNEADNITKIISAYCTNADLHPNITMYVETPSIMYDLIRRGFGIAFSPQCTGYSFYKNDLEFRLIKDMPMRHYVHMVMNNKRLITQDLQSCYNAIARFYMDYADNYNSKE